MVAVKKKPAGNHFCGHGSAISVAIPRVVPTTTIPAATAAVQMATTLLRRSLKTAAVLN